jgi:AraC family transcriptional regulator
MAILETIGKDIITAMKARESFRVETLRMAKSALKSKEIDKREPLNEQEELSVLQTMIKQRKDAAEQFTNGNRPELAAKELEQNRQPNRQGRVGEVVATTPPVYRGPGTVTGSILVREGSQILPIVPHVVRRHSSLAARGLHVEHHMVEPTEFRERELLQHNLFLYTGPAARAEIKSPEFTGMRWIHSGAIWIMPKGSRHGVRFESNMEGIALAFDPSTFDRMVQAADGKQSLPIMHSLAKCPPRIDHLMRALMHESLDENTDESIGLECIATAIALAVCQHAGAVPSEAQKTGPRLAPKQIRAVQAYVETHLHQQISLGDLAATAGLSSFHFLRSFKGSLGSTPARYVLERRMERARYLLKIGNLTVSEIGLAVGIENVSHFSRAFHRTVGVTPSNFRKSVQQ